MFVIQCAPWVSLFALFVFATSWVAVFGGVPTAEISAPLRKKYEAAVRAGNIGLALQSMLTVFVGLLVSKALFIFGEGSFDLSGLLFLECSFISAAKIRHSY